MSRYRIRFRFVTETNQGGWPNETREMLSKIPGRGQSRKPRAHQPALTTSRHGHPTAPLSTTATTAPADKTPRSLLNERIQFLRSLTIQILFCLDGVGLDRIKESFEMDPTHELTIVQFVSLMVRIACESNIELLSVNKSEIAQALAELFDAMDLNGNNSIEFSEFLETCIHWGLSSGGGIETRQVLDDPIAPFSTGASSRIDGRAARKFLHYVDGLEQVLIFEPIARKILLMEPDDLRVARTVNIPDRKVTAIEYIPIDSKGAVRKLIAIASAHLITLYDGIAGGRFKASLVIAIRIKLACLKWMAHCDLLVGGGLNGDLFAWGLDGRLVRTIHGHSCKIAAMCIVSGSHKILTGSLDRSILLRDLEFGRANRRSYRGHAGPITALALNNSSTEFISGSATGELFVWSVIDCHRLHSIPGHSCPIAFAAFAPASPEFISGDDSGRYHIWDTRLTFSHVQAIDTSAFGLNHSGAVICTKNGRRLLIPNDFYVLSWDQQMQTKGRKARRRRYRVGAESQDNNIVYATYLEPSCSFVTATSKRVRFWNALNGCLKEQYDDLMDDGEITAMCFDVTERKMIIGDSLGRIHIFNAMSGGIMKKLASQTGEILSVQYILTDTDRLVVSLGRDGHLRTYDESPILSCPTRWNIDLNHIGMSHASVLTTSSSLGLIAVGDQSGRVNIWSLLMRKVTESIKGSGEEVSGLAFLGRYPLIAISTSTSMVRIVALEPLPQHGSCLVAIDTHGAEVVATVFDDRARALYAGDTAGFISCFELRTLIDQHQLQPRVKAAHDDDRQPASNKSLTLKQRLARAKSTAVFGLPRVAHFRARHTSITSLGFIADPLSIHALAFGPHLVIWSPNGEELGVLGTLDICRRSTQRLRWRFRVDTEKRLLRADMVARQVLESITFNEQEAEVTGDDTMQGDRRSPDDATSQAAPSPRPAVKSATSTTTPVFITELHPSLSPLPTMDGCCSGADDDWAVPSFQQRREHRRVSRQEGVRQPSSIKDDAGTTISLRTGKETAMTRSNGSRRTSAMSSSQSISRLAGVLSRSKRPIRMQSMPKLI